jgi:hypothetical protein
MASQFLDRIKDEYNVYAVAGFFFSLVYVAAIGVTIFVTPPEVSVENGDLISGLLLALVTYGTVVMLVFGVFGIIYSTAIPKKGKTFAIITLLMPLLLIASIYYFWPNVFL